MLSLRQEWEFYWQMLLTEGDDFMIGLWADLIIDAQTELFDSLNNHFMT